VEGTLTKLIDNAIEPAKLFVGQKIKLVCPYLSTVFRHNDGTMVATVTDIFCVDDVAWQISLKSNTSYFRWDSRRDGGVFFLLNERKYEGI
jgi:hypothetical protein